MTKLVARRAAVALVFLGLFASVAIPQNKASLIATKEDFDRDMQLVPCKGSDRLDAVEKLFKSLGATDADISVVDLKGIKDLVVTKKGSGDEMIVVGAHYDKWSEGCGAIDNWTGIVAIAHIYASISKVETTKTFKFIAFDQEEKGLIGSDVFVRQVPKEARGSYCSMVNLDSFGFGYPQVMENTSNAKMVAAAREMWSEMKIDLSVASIPNADADSSSFLKGGIPAITFHGLNANWPKFLHSSNDKLANVNTESVFLGYRLVLPFVARLDRMSCDVFRKK